MASPHTLSRRSSTLRLGTSPAPRPGFQTADLLPQQQLEAVDDAPAGTWQSLGDAPQFLAAGESPAGWARVRVRMRSTVRGRLAIHVGRREGEPPTECIERTDVYESLVHEFYVHFPEPIRTVRLDPLDGPGRFVLDEFEVRPVPAPVAWWRALQGKLGLLWAHDGLLPRALARGLGLLARGELRLFTHKLFRGLRPPSIVGPDYANLNADYQTWRRRRQLFASDRDRMRAQAAAWSEPPRISVLMPVYDPPERFLRQAIESVQGQLYPHWELCIVDDGSTAPHVRRTLEEYAGRDPRIRLASHEDNRGISAATNSALERATGDYVALLDHDDELAEHALFRVAEAIVADRSLDMIYSDEDKLEPDGRHVEPFFKPDWSPELFLACMYTCHLGVYRTRLVRQISGFRSEFDSAQDYDLVLRLTARTGRIHHIPDVLYHWRKLPTSAATAVAAKPQAPEAGRRALEDHLRRQSRPGSVEPGRFAGLHRVRFALQDEPQVSIIIASACRPMRVRGKTTYHIERCVESIRSRSTYRNCEILLVHHPNDVSPDLADRLDRLGVARLARGGPFNWSAAMNLGAAAAGGDHLLFLNDDTEVITPDWLESLLEFSQLPEIGAVGPQLVFPDGTLQHAGVVVEELTPRHAFYRFPADHPGYFSSNVMHRNVGAVTGACLMTRADLFQAVGGFCERLPLNYSDVDYCLRVQRACRRVVYTPHARLYHFEGATKPGTFEAELRAFQERWRERWPRDPYYNPNLSEEFGDYRIRGTSRDREGAR